MVERQAHPYPVAIQGAFGLSFLAFLIFFDRIRQERLIVWAWSAAQIALGVLLIRQRLRARKRVLRCVRCDHGIP